MTFSIGYQILNCSAVRVITQSEKAAIDGFVSNEMIVNPDKFQAILAKRNNKTKDSYTLNVNQEVINSENCVKLKVKLVLNLIATILWKVIVPLSWTN